MLSLMLIIRHDLISSGIKCILQDAKDLHIVSRFSNCEEAIAATQEKKAEITIIALDRRDSGMLEGIQRLVRRVRPLKALIITDYLNEIILSHLLRNGIYGCLSMDTNLEEILKALKAMKNGKRYVGADIANYLATSATTKDPSPFKQLSNRELQVALMITHGLASKEIATRLFIDSKTISTYRNGLFNKLNVKNEIEMILLAAREGLVETP
jgi:two-component system, NarL family, invasion response regulator UvrY